jgi:acetylglutamate kinase
VVKYGGHAMTDEKLKDSFIKDILLLKLAGIHPIVVHGGGPQIEEVLTEMGIESKYHNGMRITDAKTMEVVMMVLLGRVNYEIVSKIIKLGGSAVGLAGADGNLIVARKMAPQKDVRGGAKAVEVDLGFVGEIVQINPNILLRTISEDLFIPIVAPVGVSEQGEPLNINADEAASDIARAVKAEKLILLTDVSGVKDRAGNLIPELSRKDAEKMIKDGTISGGMIPKVRNACESVEKGVHSVAIVDGRVEHALLLEIFTDTGVGTLIC